MVKDIIMVGYPYGKGSPIQRLHLAECYLTFHFRYNIFTQCLIWIMQKEFVQVQNLNFHVVRFFYKSIDLNFDLKRG